MKAKFIIIILLTVIALIIAFQNTETVTLHFFFWQLACPVSW